MKTIMLVLLLIILFCILSIIMLVVFIPATPIMILAFPGILLSDAPNNPKHWSAKPYMWYFNNVWITIVDAIVTPFDKWFDNN